MSAGANIKKRRLQLRMSQQELADAMGYKTRSTIAKIEAGENDVSHKKLVRFAQVLDTTLEALVGGYSTVLETEQGTPLNRNRQKNVVVVLAGGKAGENLQSIPTQFLHIWGKPILIYAVEAYQNHPSIDEIYVVCTKNWERIVWDYAEQYGITKLQGVVTAGTSGILSLKNAVDFLKQQLSADDFVIVQEATRPMVTLETVSKLLQAVSENGSATVGHSMKDYVQFMMDEKKAHYLDRNAIIAQQSPEAHRFSLLCGVFEQAKRRQHPMTESSCTMLLHNLGYQIHFIESNINNIKLMREEDIAAFQNYVRTG